MRTSLVVLIFGIILCVISIVMKANDTYMIMSNIWLVGSLILKELERE